MILTFEQLVDIRGVVTMVDGSFDPLHEGHIEYFRQAFELGNPVLCNIASDTWTSQKHRILLPQRSRARVIDALRYIAFVHCSSHTSAEIIEQVRPRVLVKGKDWELRGGVPQAEKEICVKHGTRIVYLDTVLNSSTQLLMNFADEST